MSDIWEPFQSQKAVINIFRNTHEIMQLDTSTRNCLIQETQHVIVLFGDAVDLQVAYNFGPRIEVAEFKLMAGSIIIGLSSGQVIVFCSQANAMVRICKKGRAKAKYLPNGLKHKEKATIARFQTTKD